MARRTSMCRVFLLAVINGCWALQADQAQTSDQMHPDCASVCLAKVSASDTIGVGFSAVQHRRAQAAHVPESCVANVLKFLKNTVTSHADSMNAELPSHILQEVMQKSDADYPKVVKKLKAKAFGNRAKASRRVARSNSRYYPGV